MKITTPLTADTITDEQIRELWRASFRKPETRRLCEKALRNSDEWDKACRALCAEILNARAAKSETP